MTRVHGALGVGVAGILVAWGLGSSVIAAAAIAIVVAAVAAAAWTRLVRDRVIVSRALPRGRLVEGDTLRYRVTRAGPRLPGTYTLHENVTRLGERAFALGRGQVEVSLDSLPRGRLALGPSVLRVEDPLGLAEVIKPVDAIGHVLVRPRLPQLGAIQTDGSGRLRLGRGAALRQPAGTDLHGVREYRPSEPMRAVHWVSTARRGRLMVRELEEPTADDVAIVLDLDARADVGPPGRSSLDEAARITGALAVAHNARGRAVRVVVAAATRRALTVRSPGDVEAMLDVLAAAEPRTRGGWSAEGGGSVPTVLVTARADSVSRTAERLDAVVLVDAPSYGDGVRHATTAPLLGLAGRGVGVTVVRAGDDLAEVLAGPSPTSRARG